MGWRRTAGAMHPLTALRTVHGRAGVPAVLFSAASTMKFMKSLKLSAFHSIRGENSPFFLVFMRFMVFMVRLAGGFRKRPCGASIGQLQCVWSARSNVQPRSVT